MGLKTHTDHATRLNEISKELSQISSDFSDQRGYEIRSLSLDCFVLAHQIQADTDSVIEKMINTAM